MPVTMAVAHGVHMKTTLSVSDMKWMSGLQPEILMLFKERVNFSLKQLAEEQKKKQQQ